MAIALIQAPPPSPPAEKATACQDQAGQASTRDGTRYYLDRI